MYKKGFTLAEVLITLTIIGIVSAIALPSLTANVQEKTWESQRKALHARLSQAISQLDKLSDYGTYSYDAEAGKAEDNAAETFIVEGLSKVYKIKNVCTSDKMENCGVPDAFDTIEGTAGVKTRTFPKKMSQLVTDRRITVASSVSSADKTIGAVVDTKAAAILTNNGESIAVFYNPYCGEEVNVNFSAIKKMCVNFIYDLNGLNGPNRIGKDMGFITAFYRTNSVVVAPMPVLATYTSVKSYDESANDADTKCKTLDENYRLPDKEEGASIAVNQSVLSLTDNRYYLFWTSSIVSLGNDGYAWRAGGSDMVKSLRSQANSLVCIKS